MKIIIGDIGNTLTKICLIEEKNFRIKNLEFFKEAGFPNKRYEDWSGDLGNLIHDSKTSLDIIHKKVIEDNIEPKPKSGQQEFLENLINKYL